MQPFAPVQALDAAAGQAYHYLGQTERYDQALLQHVMPHLVKLRGYDRAGTAVSEFSGVLYSTEQPLIVTSGRAWEYGKTTDSGRASVDARSSSSSRDSSDSGSSS